ncbi:hypothetical protein AB4582_01315 [Vibrio splendidus]|uniref:Flavodoxin n=1 Tax=Vibrio splendidus TaxID=29497 RepID=A0ABD5A6V5_VIBSP|nr:hypothetical protein [Vibrio splendidus]MCC5516757.1 hypothetical protein [Vibrio splendidus]MDP2488905.1 hypothetical protein [Vibrio splendidus]PMI29028.1 hypothetical protein BCU48_14660 [Vibrio splendidus]PMO53669.1 hypothetical protein BCT08_17660 [Vibrio splendidus]
MNNEIPESAHKKNQWLFSQLDIAYPAKESLLGRELYQSRLPSKNYQLLAQDQIPSQIDELHKVDFHKLTVLFSLNQASVYHDETERAHMLEFLSQIMLSDEHVLYIGTQNGDVVASAIVTEAEESLLISDVIIENGQDINGFAKQLHDFWAQDHASHDKVWVEN